MIELKTAPGAYVLEDHEIRGELWGRAWRALQATGRDIDDYMLMTVRRADVPGGFAFDFKQIDTREYVRLPASGHGCPRCPHSAPTAPALDRHMASAHDMHWHD